MYKDNQDRIDAYLRGEMSADQRLSFEKDLKSDANLYDEYLQTKAIAEAIKDRKEKLQQMAAWDAQEEIKANFDRRRLKIRRWTVGLSVAACIAVGFFAVRPLFLFNSTPSPMATPDFPSGIVYRGADNSLSRVDSLITAKRYHDANAVCDSLLDNNALEISAIQDLDSITERDSYRLQQLELEKYDLEWCRINILIALGRKEQAKQALKAFVAKDGEYKSEANLLLKTLRNN